MARIVFVTQRLDPDDPALGATVAKVAALAQRFDDVAVLANGVAQVELPGNCRVRSFAGRNRALRTARLIGGIAAELVRRPAPDAVLAHMAPVFALLVSPLTTIRRVRLLLWFTHWKVTRRLRAAERVVDGVLTVDSTTFPIASAKVTALGHGIDTAEFPCREAHAAAARLRLLALGRYSDAKGLDVVIRAVAAYPEAELDAYGPTLTDAERAHLAVLERLVHELEVTDRVRLHGPVRRRDVPRLLAGCDALVNNMRAGAADKVVYEAAASCVPVVVSSPAFDSLLDGLEPRLRFERDQPDELRQRLVDLARLSVAQREQLGEALRRRVVEAHSVQSWADGVLKAATA